jgi:hypothetical protein
MWTASVRNGSWLTSTGTRGLPIAPETARSARSRRIPASSRAVTWRFTVAMLSPVTLAMTSRAMGPRTRAAPKTAAAAASATRSEGATMWWRASSARLACDAAVWRLPADAVRRAVVESEVGVDTLSSLREVGWWVFGPHLATQQDEEVRVQSGAACCATTTTRTPDGDTRSLTKGHDQNLARWLESWE